MVGGWGVNSKGYMNIECSKGIRRVENKGRVRERESREPGRWAECWEGGDGGEGGQWYLVCTAKLPHLLSAAVPVV